MDKPFVDYYSVLGVKQRASSAELKKVFCNQILIHHPDRNPRQTREQLDKCKSIIKAYKVLSDPTQRIHYDIVYQLQKIGHQPVRFAAEEPTGSAFDFRIVYIVGGCIILCFIAYKTIQIVKALNKIALHTSGLTGADYMVTQTVGSQLPAEKLVSQVIESPSVAPSGSPCKPLTAEMIYNACRWRNAGATGSYMVWTVGQLSSDSGVVQSPPPIERFPGSSSDISLFGAVFQCCLGCVRLLYLTTKLAFQIVIPLAKGSISLLLNVVKGIGYGLGMLCSAIG